MDALGLSEFAQDGRRIVADADQPDPAALELAFDLLQLNELRFAVGSPGGAAVEDDERSAPGAPLVEPDQLALGIWQLEVGEDLAQGRADQPVVRFLGHGTTNWGSIALVPGRTRNPAHARNPTSNASSVGSRTMPSCVEAQRCPDSSEAKLCT